MIAKKEMPGKPWSRSFRTTTALFAVILAVAQSGVYTDVGTIQFFEKLTRWSIPAMFMLWGMKDTSNDKPGIGYALSSRVIPAIGTLLLWGMTYGLLEEGLTGRAIGFGTFRKILNDLLMGDGPEYLWMLYPLIGLYLVYPLIQRFTTDASKGETIYMLVLCFIVASLLPTLNKLMPLNENVVGNVLGRLHIDMVAGWLGCYLAGWYIFNFEMSNLEEDLIYILGVAGIIVTFAGGMIFKVDGVDAHAVWSHYSAPNVVLTALAVCTLFRYIINDRAGRSSRSLGHFAMGMYFCHQLWFMVFIHYGLDFKFAPDGLAIVCMSVIMFLLSIPIALILNLIPKLGDIMT